MGFQEEKNEILTYEPPKQHRRLLKELEKKYGQKEDKPKEDKPKKFNIKKKSKWV